MLPFGFNLAHIQLGNASILVDSGGFDDPSSGMRQVFPSFLPSPGLQTGLASIGIPFEAITHVLITHAHLDHFRGVTTDHDGQRIARFPHARHLIGRGDWDVSRTDEQPDEELTRCLKTIEELGLLDVVDDEREVVPGITMLPMPGETPGHCIVRVRSKGERFYYLGDLFHYACEVEHPDWMDAGRDQTAMRKSRDHLMAEAAHSDAILVFAHAPFPGWGRIISTETGYQWEWG